MLIEDWMTRDPVTITDDTSLIRAIHIINEHHFRRLPVMNAGRLVGLVTDRDLKAASPSRATTLDVHEMYYLMAEMQVKEIMSRDPITVSQDATVEEAAQTMLAHTISGLPVVDAGGSMVGIITQSDILRALLHISGSLQGGVQFALRLEDRPGVLREVADLMRAKGGRLLSLLSCYLSPEENLREVYVRVKNLSPEAVAAIQAELAARFEVLYVIQERRGAGE
ncbi:MAG: CBS and ACT domain-containing protein [Desulfobaccales bacterium]|jgi:acetoin utilization protein AcuB